MTFSSGEDRSTPFLFVPFLSVQSNEIRTVLVTSRFAALTIGESHLPLKVKNTPTLPTRLVCTQAQNRRETCYEDKLFFPFLQQTSISLPSHIQNVFRSFEQRHINHRLSTKGERSFAFFLLVLVIGVDQFSRPDNARVRRRESGLNNGNLLRMDHLFTGKTPCRALLRLFLQAIQIFEMNVDHVNRLSILEQTARGH